MFKEKPTRLCSPYWKSSKNFSDFTKKHTTKIVILLKNNAYWTHKALFIVLEFSNISSQGLHLNFPKYFTNTNNQKHDRDKEKGKCVVF